MAWYDEIFNMGGSDTGLFTGTNILGLGLAGLSILGSLSGQDKQDKLNDQQLQFQQDKLAQDKELTLAQIKAQLEAAGAAAAAQKEIAKMQAVQNAYSNLIGMSARGAESQRDALTGIVGAVQRPLLSFGGR